MPPIAPFRCLLILVCALQLCAALPTPASAKLRYLASIPRPEQLTYFGQVACAAPAPDGSIYAFDGSTLQRLDDQGRRLNRWAIGSDLLQLGSASAVALDSAGNLFVTDPRQHRVVKFAPDGSLLLWWGTEGSENGQFRAPEGVAVGTVQGVEYVFVADSGNHRVQVFDVYGHLVPISFMGAGDYLFDTPKGIACHDPYLYVVDSGNDRIKRLNALHINNHLILLAPSNWGTPGSGVGQFSSPHGLAVDVQGHVYVADTENSRIQVFAEDGSALRNWGVEGTAPGQFQTPRDVAIAQDGSVLVADTTKESLQFFSAGGGFLRELSSFGPTADRFHYPFGIAAGPDGTIYVADSWNSRVKVYSREGSLLGILQTFNGGDSFAGRVADVAVSPQGRVYVCDTEGHRIVMFDSQRNYLGSWGDGGQFDKPTYVAASQDAVYVAEGGYVKKYDPDGNFLLQWVQMAGAMAVAPDGHLWIAEFFVLHEFLPDGVSLGELPCGHSVEGLAISKEGHFLLTTLFGFFVADRDGTILEFVENPTHLSGDGPGEFNYPLDIAPGIDGSVWITDSNNHRLQIWRRPMAGPGLLPLLLE